LIPGLSDLVHWPKGKVTATLEDTPTARQVVETLPCESSANTWGDEVYFSVTVKAKMEADARQVLDPGTVCFWEGSSFALPFGPTPVSHGDECRLVAKVNIPGKIEGDPKALKSVREGDRIRVELAQLACPEPCRAQ
jgi:uncharacterized protein